MTNRQRVGCVAVVCAAFWAGMGCDSGDPAQTQKSDGIASDTDVASRPADVVGMVGFVPASDGQSVLRVTFPEAKAEEIGFPDGGLSGKLMAVHFSSATSGAAVVRSADALKGTVYDYDAVSNAWVVRGQIPSDRMLALSDGVLPTQVFSDAAGNVLVLKVLAIPAENSEGQGVWAFSPNLIAFDAGSSQPDFSRGEGSLGSACVDPACPQIPQWLKMKVLGVSQLTPNHVLHLLADPRTDQEDPRKLQHIEWESSGHSGAAVTEPPYGQREFLGSFDQQLTYLMGPEPMYCSGTTCEEIPADSVLPLIHSYGPPVALVSPGSLGPGTVSLFDLRGRLYEMEIQIPGGSNDSEIQGYFPDERGPQWIRLVTWTEGTGSATEFSVNLDTFEVTQPGAPTYSDLMATAEEADGRYRFRPGYFYYVTE